MLSALKRGVGTGLMMATAARAMIASSTVEGSGTGGGFFDPARSPLGKALLSGFLTVWGIGHETVLGPVGRRAGLAAGALCTLGGHAFDRFVLPEGARRTVGPVGLIFKNIGLGLTADTVVRLRIRRKRRARADVG